MDALLVAWSSWLPRSRERVLRVDSVDVVRLIDMNMRMLWTAEIQAQQFGVKAPVHPFDSAKLPLLSTMQFDGGYGDGIHQSVKWPQHFYDDPMVMPTAIRNALQPVGAKLRSAPKILDEQRWAHLLQPPPKSWVEFERQLALLVEQLVLHARQVELVAACAASAAVAASSSRPPLPTAARAPDSAADAAPAPANPRPGGEQEPTAGDEDGADEAAGLSAASTSRAAKRARQRERRRMGKAQERAAAAEMAGPMPPVADHAAAFPSPAKVLPGGSFQACVENGMTVPPFFPVPSVVPPFAEQARQTANGTKDSASPHVDMSVVSVLRAQVEQLSGQLSGREGSLSAASQLPQKVNAVGMPLDGSLPAATANATQAASTVASAPAASSSSCAGAAGGAAAGDEDDDEGIPKLAGFGGAARGVGRGRPMGGQLQSVYHGPAPHGRGRALAPPPGLAGISQSSTGIRAPGGLSQTWMPGPAIPEDDEEGDQELPDLGLSHNEWQLPGLELPPGGLDLQGSYFRERMSSYWSNPSYAGTPVMAWSKTPSPPMSPASGVLRHPRGVGLSAASTPLHVPSTPGGNTPRLAENAEIGGGPPHLGPQLAPGFIPMYVTVPLALAQQCPHCGNSFATVPGSAGVQTPAAGAGTTNGVSDWAD